MTFLREDESFESFVTQARALLGQDVARDWLIEVWSGADGDLNRALNHVLDSPEEKIRRGKSGDGGKSSSKSAAPAKSSKPARLVSADFEPAFADPPKPKQPQQQQQQQIPLQTAGSLYIPPHHPLGVASAGPFLMPQTASVLAPPGMVGGAWSGQLGPQPGMQQSSTLQSSAMETLSVLRGSLELILSAPSMLHNAAIMSQLKQQLLHALEIPEATLVLQERAKRVDDQQKRIQSMQDRLAGLLADPSIARNPGLIQSLGDQMNELRRITAANLQEQEQLRTSLATNTPADILLLAGGRDHGRGSRGDYDEMEESSSSTGAEMDEDWWERKKLKKQRRSARATAAARQPPLQRPRPPPVVASAPNLQATNPFRSTHHTQALQQAQQAQQPQQQLPSTQVFQTRSQF